MSSVKPTNDLVRPILVISSNHGIRNFTLLGFVMSDTFNRYLQKHKERVRQIYSKNVYTEELKDTQYTTWIERHDKILFSNFSILIDEDKLL